MTIERNHHKAIVEQAEKACAHTNYSPYMQLLVAPSLYTEKYAFISRSINANVKIIQIDGTRYSCRCALQECVGSLLTANGGNWLLFFSGKCKN